MSGVSRAWPGAALLVLGACASSSSSQRGHGVGEPGYAGPGGAAGAAGDASYDWHVLLPAPFGMLLKDSKVALHEVLQFHDATHAAVAVDNTDCYASDARSPRFVGEEPEDYLLCFDHDRLSRVEASVRLAVANAMQVFARACALWSRNSAPTTGTVCEGQDDGIAFSARLVPTPGDATSLLTMTLASAATIPTHDAR